MKIVDANILLHAVNAGAAQHEKCRLWLEAALVGDEEIGIDWIILLAFVRISTQPRTFAEPLSVDEAVERMSEWLSTSSVRLIEPTPNHWAILSELLLSAGTAGNLTTDAHLAALAISHNATLVSGDNDFARFRRLKWENPLAVP